MDQFVSIDRDGHFALAGKRWYCNSVIYFGHFPGGFHDWFAEDVWPLNRPRLEPDFARMEAMGINHASLVLRNQMLFDGGRPVARGYDCLDEVVRSAARHGIRVSIFLCEFVDTEEEYHRVTGEKWNDGNRWLPSFNETLFDAYVRLTQPLAQRYRDEPAVLGYVDRIDRFFKGFSNVGIPFNLKQEWAEFLKGRYGSFRNLLDAVGGPEALENRPADFHEVLMPQESRHNASLKNPLAFDYILWQKKTIGDTQARWDAATAALAPRQVLWTAFEGCTTDWAMLDGFSPETKKLRAVWMEFYHWHASHMLPAAISEWGHTPEFVTQRQSVESPSIYNTAYLLARYIKLSVRQPVVICHGVRLDFPAMGAASERDQLAIMDRVNAACLEAGCDGWHYWCWTDDWESSLAHRREQSDKPEEMYFQGESMGLVDYEGHPRPVAALVSQYSAQLRRLQAAAPPDRAGEALLLSSSPRMYNLFRRLAVPTAAAVSGAMTRLGVRADCLWSSQNDTRIAQETLDAYKLIVIADSMYERDFRDTPDKLLRFVENGGTLVLPLDRYDSFKDEHGVAHDSASLRRLSGVDPTGPKDWPGAGVPCRNWPLPTGELVEPGWDVQAAPRVHWGICPQFRHRAPLAQRVQMLGFRSLDGDTFTRVPGLVAGAEVIAVAKFPTGALPFLYRHRVGKGTVYVNAWTNNIFRDTDYRTDHGGWEYDFILALAIETAGLSDVDLARGASLWLRNAWGYSMMP